MYKLMIKTPIRFRHRHGQGFTLIEVLLATLLLGITIGAVSAVIRTGMKAWRTGHGAAEIGQTIRITQDVLLRDLDNMYFETEKNYNQAFRAQMEHLAAGFAQNYMNNRDARELQQAIQSAISGDHGKRRGSSRKNREDGQQDAFDDLNLATIAPPLNLSFHGTANRLSFSRSYKPRFPGDQDTWGLRRVTYFVRDKVLYRKEEDPFGMRMAAMAADMPQLPQNTMGQADDPMPMIRDQLMKLFAVPDEEEGKEASATDQDAPASKLLPTQVRLEEPLCSGVEIFKIKYGFFIGGQWQEDQNWDSAAGQHRTPPPDLNVPPGAPPPPAMQGAPEITVPDDLPGYVMIQIGLRMPDGKGRLYSFTIQHSLPRAQETDVMREDGQAFIPPTEGVPTARGGGAASERDKLPDTPEANRFFNPQAETKY